MNFNIKEIAEQLLTTMQDNYDTSLLEYLLDNKPILRRIAYYRLERTERDCHYFWTILHGAARYGRADILKLLDRGSCVMEALDERKRTPLWYAAAYSHNGTLFQLLESGAKTKHADIDGWTPLHVAARYGHLKTCQILLDYGSDIEHRDNTGFTILHKTVRSENEELLKFLLKTIESLNPNTLIDSGSFHHEIAPLHLATEYGNLAMIILLVEATAKINKKSVKNVVDQPTKTRLTSLMIACQQSHEEIVDYAIKHNARIDCETNNGWSALHMAVKGGSIKIIQTLLKNGAQLEVKNKNGWTPFLLAANLGKIDIMRVLVCQHANCFAITGIKGLNALHLASQTGHSTVLRYLIVDQQLSPSTITRTGGQTALHLAASRGYEDCCKVLLQFGCPVNAVDITNRTALQLAARNSHVHLFKLLLSNGGNIMDTKDAFNS